MYPGTATGVEKTILGRYETVTQCETARRHLDLRYNSSAECKKIGKKI